MRLFIIILVFLLSTSIAIAQSNTDLPYQVNVNHAPLSISLDQLHNASSLVDLNRMFRPEWVKEYLSVEISSIQEDKVVNVYGVDHMLNQEQKNFLKQLKFPAPISVELEYIPENELKDNPPRKESFTISIHPTNNASYPGGNEGLLSYFKENAIEKIANEVFVDYDLAILIFTINELGQVIDVSVFNSSKDVETDKVLFDAACNMPDWTAAVHTSGKKVRQQFALTVGNHENCMVNLLNTVNNKY